MLGMDGIAALVEQQLSKRQRMRKARGKKEVWVLLVAAGVPLTCAYGINLNDR